VFDAVIGVISGGPMEERTAWVEEGSLEGFERPLKEVMANSSWMPNANRGIKRPVRRWENRAMAMFRIRYRLVSRYALPYNRKES
jgi:hypothetical protein